MAMQTFSRLYDDHDDAVHIVQALEQAGIPHSDVSLVANNVDAHHGADGASGTGLTSGDPEKGVGTGGGTGATLGTVLGGGAGLLAGLGMLAIPGVGPIVAAGWLVATLAGAGLGAAAGGLVGSLTGAGVSEADAHTYSEGVRRGGSLVTVAFANIARLLSVEHFGDLKSSAAPINSIFGAARQHRPRRWHSEPLSADRRRRA